MKRKLLVIPFLFLIILFLTGCVFAVSTGFETESINEDLQKNILSDIELTVFYSEPDKSSIKCFDVNDNGLIALGSSRSTDKRICVYDADGVFKYGYEFVAYGDFGVEWDGDNLNIYFIRGNIIASFNSKGECLGVLSAEDSIENDSYFRRFIQSDERIVGDKKYVVSNDIGILGLIAPSYSKLSVTDSDGEITVLYDVGEQQFANILGTLILSIIFVIIAFTGIYVQLKKQKHNTANAYQF